MREWLLWGPLSLALIGAAILAARWARRLPSAGTVAALCAFVGLLLQASALVHDACMWHWPEYPWVSQPAASLRDRLLGWPAGAVVISGVTSFLESPPGMVILLAVAVFGVTVGASAWRAPQSRRCRPVGGFAVVVSLVLLALMPGPKLFWGHVMRVIAAQARAEVQQRPSDPEAHKQYSAALAGIWRLEDALVEASKARSLDTKGNPDFPMQEGWVLTQMGRRRDALVPFEVAFRSRERYRGIAEGCVAELRRSSGAPPFIIEEDARGARSGAARQAADAGRAYALCLISLGRLPEAREVIRSSVVPWPGAEKSLSSSWMLLLLDRALGDETAARKDLSELARMDPRGREYVDRRAGRTTRPAQARRELERWARDM